MLLGRFFACFWLLLVAENLGMYRSQYVFVFASLTLLCRKRTTPGDTFRLDQPDLRASVPGVGSTLVWSLIGSRLSRSVTVSFSVPFPFPFRICFPPAPRDFTSAPRAFLFR